MTPPPLTWQDRGDDLHMAYSHDLYVGYVQRVDGRWTWWFAASRYGGGHARRKSDAVRRIRANWQAFLVRAGLAE